jgi:hypothetical protein
MTILIKNADIHIIDLKTRLPFKYGIATMTSAPHVFVRVEINIDGRDSFGISADHLPPKWFTKVAEKSLESEIDEMLDVVENAVSIAPGLSASSAFDLWGQILELQNKWGEGKKYPPLLYQFGVSLVERAIIEAVCKDAGISFYEAIRTNLFGVQPGKYFQEIEGFQLNKILPASPIPFANIRQTIGLADPLSDDDIPVEEKLSDGLPQSVQSLIKFYGLKHLKVKLFGDLEKDVNRLTHLADIVKTEIKEGFAFTLDGNEQFHSMDEFKDYWESLISVSGLSMFFSHLMFVEQPFHRDIALDSDVLSGLKDWNKRPLMIIDESNDRLESLQQALQIGYHGTSHKNCKGVFKSLMNACLLYQYRKDNPNEKYILSCEDLASVGPVSTIQDMAVAGALGIDSIERNGHHYFKGLSAFPEEVQKQVLSAHSDLYHPSEAGWPTLSISNGKISLDSINRSHFGVGYVINPELFEPVSQWKENNRS